MKKRLIAFLLVVVMMFSLALPAFAADPTTAKKDELRGIVENQVRNGLVGSAMNGLTDAANDLVNSDTIKNMIKDIIYGMIDIPGMISGGDLGNILGDLIGTAIGDNLGIDLPDSININDIINQVLNNEIVTNILNSEFLAKVIDKTIDGLIGTIDLNNVVTTLTEDMINGFIIDETEKIWNNGKPNGAYWLSFLNADRWISISIIAAVEVDFAAFLIDAAIKLANGDVDLDSDTIMSLLPSTEVIIDILLDAIVETAKESYNIFKAELIAKVEAEIAKFKADLILKAKEALVKELNDIFCTDIFVATMLFDDMYNEIVRIADEFVIEHGETIIDRLEVAKCLANIVGCKDAVDCIQKIIDCIRSRLPSDPCKDGHDFTSFVESTDSTCKIAGSETYKCSRCEATEIRPLALADHDYVGESKESTCTEHGYENEICSVCGDVLFNNELSLSEHTEDDQSVVATCEEAGSIKIVCSDCNEVISEEVITAPGHAYDAGVVTTPATCEADGVTTFTCANCPDTKTETIDAPGHDMGDFEVTTPATLEEAGVETAYCQNEGCEHFETRPIDALVQVVNITFPGVKGVEVRYYSPEVAWVSAGTFDDEATIEIPADALTYNNNYAIGAHKGGMGYKVDYLTFDGTPIDIDVPVKPITVTGVSSACTLAIVQANWVYNHADASVGNPNVFNVFDNGSTYQVAVLRTGYTELRVSNINAGQDVWLDIFYNVPIPDGVTNIRIANANWVDTTVWYANYMSSDVITLMKNNGNAKMTFNYDGTAYNKDFVLDGSNPFNMSVEVNRIIEPTCTLEGYTITFENILTGEKWYADYTPALGHTYDKPVWDGNGWYITCDVCGWAGYISYVYGDYATPADTTALIAAITAALNKNYKTHNRTSYSTLLSKVEEGVVLLEAKLYDDSQAKIDNATAAIDKATKELKKAGILETIFNFANRLEGIKTRIDKALASYTKVIDVSVDVRVVNLIITKSVVVTVTETYDSGKVNTYGYSKSYKSGSNQAQLGNYLVNWTISGNKVSNISTNFVPPTNP